MLLGRWADSDAIGVYDTGGYGVRRPGKMHGARRTGLYGIVLYKIQLAVANIYYCFTIENRGTEVAGTSDHTIWP